jgi:hypothetical protein
MRVAERAGAFGAVVALPVAVALAHVVLDAGPVAAAGVRALPLRTVVTFETCFAFTHGSGSTDTSSTAHVGTRRHTTIW